MILSCLIFSLKIGMLASYTQPKCYTTADGLSHDNINCILLANRGFLWIGTRYGLNRYDGYHLINIKNIPGDLNSLSDNFITALASDSSENLWIGTRKGLNHYNMKTMIFDAYFNNPEDSNSISDNYINDLYVDSNNTVWILAGNVLNNLDIKNNRLHRYHIPVDDEKSKDLILYTLEEDKDNLIWIGSSNGLYCFDKSGNKFSNLKINISDYSVKSIFIDAEGNIWLGTDRGLLKIIKSKSIIKKYYNDLKPDNPDIVNSINCMTFWSTKNLMLGTELGLYIFDIQKEEFKSINEPFPPVKKLTYYPVSCMHTDFSDLVWIGTSHGLFKLNKSPAFFCNYSSDKLTGLKGEHITSIYKDRDDALWVGTQNYGLNIINILSGEIINYNKHNYNNKLRIPSNKVPVIFEDSEGKMYLGTGKGVMIYNPAKKNFEGLCEKIHLNNCDTFKNSQIYDILEDTFKNLWFATSSGLYALNINKERQLHHYSPGLDNQSGIFEPLFVLEAGNYNNLWIGTNNGLILFNTETSNFEKYTSDSINQKYRLTGNSIFSLYADSSNILWVGTDGGLTMIDQAALRWKHYTSKNGLSSRYIYAIVEDRKNNLWLTTNNGIIKFNKNNESFRTYDGSEGLLVSEFIERSCYKSSHGEIFFGGIQGFCSFFPDSLVMNSHVPKVEITKIKYINRNTIYSIYKENFDSIVLPKCTYFTIEFSALDFVTPGKNQYMYSVHKPGSEPNWIYCGKINNVNLADIKSGSYIFRVKGSNSDVIWNNEGKTIKIIIQTSILKSKKAILVYITVLTLIIILLLIYSYLRSKRIRYINEERENISRQILEQKEELIAKNNNIMDSIKYAKRIQSALMPPDTTFKSIFPDSFILHIPKDIVSGDFYWFNKVGDRAFVAAVDCTGHGVPGAFMSIIGIELFRNITNIEGIKQPAQILATLNKDFQKIFHDKDIISFRDGMDLAFCAFDTKKMILEYAGAFNPIYIIRNSNIYEYKGDRFSVGLDKPDENKKNTFKNHIIPMQNGDSIYIFSDGYADQFGGPAGKKYKYRRFQHLLLAIHQLPMEKQHELLEKSILRWKGDLDQVDDILVIGIRIHS